ncbi:hypothetical protein [Hyphomicrobium sp.]|uniref:hypothetical protein n=1 Tax=Hyphomicrobium sp. TaxID=82 RepID=UPI003F71BC0A
MPKHVTTAPYNSEFIHAGPGSHITGLIDRTFMVTVKKEVKSYEISSETLGKLIAVFDDVAAKFTQN